MEDKEVQITRNTVVVYLVLKVKSSVMSHENVIEMPGVNKVELITLYDKLGLPYFYEAEEVE